MRRNDISEIFQVVYFTTVAVVNFTIFNFTLICFIMHIKFSSFPSFKFINSSLSFLFFTRIYIYAYFISKINVMEKNLAYLHLNLVEFFVSHFLNIFFLKKKGKEAYLCGLFCLQYKCFSIIYIRTTNVLIQFTER